MEPPFSIPNKEVKRASADDSPRATECESRSKPEQCTDINPVKVCGVTSDLFESGTMYRFFVIL